SDGPATTRATSGVGPPCSTGWASLTRADYQALVRADLVDLDDLEGAPRSQIQDVLGGSSSRAAVVQAALNRRGDESRPSGAPVFRTIPVLMVNDRRWPVPRHARLRVDGLSEHKLKSF